MLWWGWLGFNCGSTFGVSGGKWKLASRSAVCTLNASAGGGVFVTFYSYILFNRYKIYYNEEFKCSVVPRSHYQVMVEHLGKKKLK